MVGLSSFHRFHLSPKTSSFNRYTAGTAAVPPGDRRYRGLSSPIPTPTTLTGSDISATLSPRLRTSQRAETRSLGPKADAGRPATLTANFDHDLENDGPILFGGDVFYVRANSEERRPLDGDFDALRDGFRDR